MEPLAVLMVEVMAISLVTAVLYVKVSLAPVEFVVMDDEIWISGRGVSMLGEVPVVTDSFVAEKRKIVPVTTQ